MPDYRRDVTDMLVLRAINVFPWPYAEGEAPGYHDPRSAYVEDYWLPILGPSTTWLLRRLAGGFDYSPEGFEMDMRDMARSIGLSPAGGRHNPFNRALARIIQFDMAKLDGRGLLARRKLPPITQSQLRKLPASLQARYEQEVLDQ